MPIRLNRQFYVFLGCLLISTLIWLLISLSKEYTTEVIFPVEYENFPEDRIVVNQLPSELALEVNSHGFQLLSYKLFSGDQKILVDVGGLRFKDPDRRSVAFLPTRSIQKDLSEQFSDKTNILGVSPDTIFIRFTPRLRKKVVVEPSLEIEFRDQYHLSDEVRIHPPTVHISGPASILDTVERISTRKLRMEDVHDTRTAHVGFTIDSAYKSVMVEPGRVLLTIPVDEFTEGSLKIPVQVKGSPKNWTVQTYPDSVTVNFQVGFESYDKVKPDMFEAEVQLPSKEELKRSTRLKVKLSNYPAFIKRVKYEPRRVEFIIRKDKEE